MKPESKIDHVLGLSKNNLHKIHMDVGESGGLEEFQAMANSFCKLHVIKVPMPDARYVPYAKSPRRYTKQIIDVHYRRELFLGVIDLHIGLES